MTRLMEIKGCFECKWPRFDNGSARYTCHVAPPEHRGEPLPVSGKEPVWCPLPKVEEKEG